MKNIVVAFMLAGLLSCKCDEQVFCKGIPPADRGLIPFQEGQVIRFRNDVGRVVRFTVESVSADVDRWEDCRSLTLGFGCDCNCLLPSALASLRITDTLWRINRQSTVPDYDYNYYMSINPYEPTRNLDSLQMEVAVARTTARFGVKPQLSVRPFSKDSILFNLRLGSTTYNQVVKTSFDTTGTSVAAFPTHLAAAYHTLSEGLVGFYDTGTKSLFYRF